MSPFAVFVRALSKHWWALMSCAVFTLMGVYALATGQPDRWLVRASFVVAIVMLMIAAFLAWKDQYEKAEAAKPRLLVKVFAVFTHHEQNKTLILVTMRVVNHGAPSAVLQYRAQVAGPGYNDEASIVFLHGSDGSKQVTFPPLPSGQVLSFDGAAAIYNKTNVPIERGGVVNGRLPITIGGNRTADVVNGAATLTVSVTDYLGQESSDSWKGTGSTPPVFLPGEDVPSLLSGLARPPINPNPAKPSKKAHRKGRK